MSPVSPPKLSLDIGEKASRVYESERYESVPSEAGDVTLLNDQQRKRFRRNARRSALISYIAFPGLVICGGLMVWLFVRLQNLEMIHDKNRVPMADPPTNIIPASGVVTPTGKEFGECGSSPEEAQAKGCLFDPMSWLWTAPACYHKDLLDSWWAKDDWRFYTTSDLDPANEVSREFVESGQHRRLYTHRKYHKTHCSYMWQKLQKIMLNHMPIDSNLKQLHHMGHCQKVLLHEIYHEDVNCTEHHVCPTQLTPVFTTCGWW